MQPDTTVFQLQSGSINITYPTSGQIFNPGDIIPISITSSNGINRMILAGMSSDDNIFTTDTLLSNGNINHTVPLNAFGRIGIIVLGYDTVSGLIDHDTVIIKINQTASLDSISYYPETIYVQEQSFAPVTITGYFNNGYSHNISYINGLQFQVADTNIAKHYIKNLIKGKQIGNTQLTVSYMGQSKIIPIVVYPRDTSIAVIDPTQNIAVISPVYNFSMQVGDSCYITWTDNIPENVKIELYKGFTFSKTISNSSLSNGSFPWLVPPDLTTDSVYKIKITSVSNSNLFDYSDNFTIIASSNPIPQLTSFSINAGAATTTNPTVTLNNAVTNNPTHYMASENSYFIGAMWKTYSTNPSFTLSSGYGIKTVYMKMKNILGESDILSDNIEYIIPLIPVAAFTANVTIICTGSSVSFTDQSTNSPSSWQWSFEGGSPASSSLQNPVAVYNNTGIFNVSLMASNASGSTQIVKNDYITVQNLPVAPVGATAYPESVIPGEQVILTVTPANPGTNAIWRWYTDSCGSGQPVGTGDSIVVYPENNTTYYVRAEGCDTTICRSVTIIVNPCTLTVSPDTLFIEYFQTSGIISVNTGYNCHWKLEKNDASWIYLNTTNFTGTDNATIILTGKNYNCDRTGKVFIIYSSDTAVCVIVHSGFIKSPEADFIAAPVSGMAPLLVNFRDTSSCGKPDRWLWTFYGAEPNSSTDHNPANILYDRPGKYTVKLTAVNDYGSDDIYKQGYILVLPHHDNDTAHINISPNPAKDKTMIEINSPGTKQYTLKLLNSAGQEVYRENFSCTEGNNIKTIDLRNYSPGVYFLSIVSDKDCVVRKLTIEK
ncbi:MAG: PKD domain-containing protein [Bacteroidia bacterium]|nr:PKD domain-containing protein [Bacteroidia bacterium]